MSKSNVLPPAATPPRTDGLPLVSPDAIEEQQIDLDNMIPSRGYDMLPVVGLGGSAGSISALKEFFDNTPADTGLAYVVVLHLSPEHKSSMPALLQRHTRMPVRAAADSAKIEANTVYVIPPGKYLTAADGRLRLTDLQAEPGSRVAVDMFFRSLADAHGPHAMAVVLSGADGDGAIGLRRIKERGGLTIAQDPQEAEHAGMPRSAIDTGMVDLVLRVAEMPARIIAYHATAKRLRLPPEEGPTTKHAELPPSDFSEAVLCELLAFLRTRTGCDFSYYKRATILRRISRRMQVNGVDELSGYLNFLRTHPGEAGALKGDLLISVTNFFRDREAFAALEEYIPELFRDKGPNDAVRVWTPACATGEETYSMAMLLLEHAQKIGSLSTIQVFGCDLSDEAIQQARAGLYPATIAADVSAERLERFFVKEPGGYRVRRDLREMVLFATHDLLKDAPFSRMDLISCRNLLIYLNDEAQRRVLEIFNFALRPGGRLFLGTSESVEEGSAIFAPINKKYRIYRQLSVQRVGLPTPMGSGATQRAVQQHERLRYAHSAMPGRAFQAHLPPMPEAKLAEEGEPANEVHFKLLGRFGPPSLVVNAAHEIVHLSDNAHRFLRLPEGEPTRNLLELVHPTLRVELRTALLRAEESGKPVEISGRILELPDGPEAVDVRVVPAGELAPGSLLVMFEEHEAIVRKGGTPLRVAGPAASEAMVQQLDRELSRAAANLRHTVEQYESSGEQLKASNEELQAMNEELRSAGEELETSREEFQSVNEELTTVNFELRSRLEELHRSNGDLQNLMSSTQIATVFLDRGLRVRRYTPTAVPLFHLIPGDVGRPITDLERRLSYPELVADAQDVLRTLIPVEREVRDAGRWLLARAQPYRTVEDQIGGVVLTFVDITDRRLAVEALRESEAKYRTLYDSMDQGYCIIQMLYEDGRPVDWLYVEVNPAFEKHNGLANATGRTVRAMAPTIEQKWMDIFGGVAETGESLRIEEDSPTFDGRVFDLYAFRVGKPDERKVAVLFTDITERKRADVTLRESEERQAFLLKLSDAIRAQSSVDAIGELCTRRLGEQLQVDRCYLSQLFPEEDRVSVGPEYNGPGVVPVSGEYRLSDFPEIVRRIETGTGVFPDVPRDPLLTDADKIGLAALDIGAFIIASVRRGEKVLWSVSVTSVKPRAWTAGEVTLMEDVAERIWAAVQRALGEEALRVSEERQAFLLQLSDALRPLGDAAAIERAACRQLGEHLRSDHTYYAEIDVANNYGVVRHDHARDGAVPFVAEYRVSDLGFVIPLYQRGEPVVVNDVFTSPLIPDADRANTAASHTSWIAVPVVKDGLLVGSFCTAMRTAREWTEREVQLTAETAERVWAAIERAKAETALQESEAQLAVELADTQQLQRISSSLVEEDNIDALYDQILEAARSIMRSDAASIQQLIPERDELLLVAQRGLVPESAEHWRWVSTAESTSCGLAMAVGERVIVPDAEQSDMLAGTEDLKYYRLSGIRAMQSTRLVSRGGRLVGMISTHWRDVHVPTDRQLRLFDVLARQVADLIERRAAAEALRHSENRLRTLADAVPQIIWSSSGEGVADYFNKRWYEYSGLSFEESYDLGWKAIVHPDDALASKACWERALAAGEVFGTEYRLRGADGAYRWFIGRNVPMQDGEGRVSGWFGTATDIDVLKNADAFTRASEEQFRCAIEDAPIPVIMHAEDGQVLQISKTWTELTGYTAEDMPTFDAWLSRAYEAGADDVRAQMHQLFRGEVRRMSVDFNMVTRLGALRRWSFSASAPGTLHDGRRFVVGMALDITEREQVELALKKSLEETERARAAAESASGEKDRFFAVLSHELRTPLTPILFATEILALSGELSPKSQEVVAMIGRNVRLEAAIIDDLLDVTRIGRGTLEITQQLIDLHEVIRSAISITEPDLTEKAQRFTVKLDATEHQLNGDFTKLQQVMWNLLKNASKFSPASSVIEVRTRNERDVIVVEVADNGVGIESAALSLIFDAFTQASESITREYGGLGLGLAIAKGIVDAHGGQVCAESAGPGQGATFIVHLSLNEK